MTDANNEVIPPSQPAGAEDDSKRNIVALVYILYIAGFIIPFASLGGVIVAHVKAKELVGSWLESHNTYLIRSFWIAFIAAIVGAVLSFIVIGFFLLLAVGVWFIYRIVKGGLRFMDRKPIEDPQGWF